MELWIDQRVADDLVVHAQAAFPLETGGLLVGYVTEQGPVVTALIGPGPRASATSVSFNPDSAFQRLALHQAYERTDGQDTYLGDWHSHPSGVAALSRLDRHTLINIAHHKAARLREPTMLIAAGENGQWELGAFVARRRFWGKLKISRVQVRYFSAPAD